MQDGALYHLGDANGNPIILQHAVQLSLRFGNVLYHRSQFVVEMLACPLLVGTEFINQNVEATWCIQQHVQLTRAQIRIVPDGTRYLPWMETPPDAGQPQKPPFVYAFSHVTRRVRLCLPLLLCAYTQVKNRHLHVYECARGTKSIPQNPNRIIVPRKYTYV